MTPDQLNEWKARMQAVADRESSPAGQAFRRFVAGHVDAAQAPTQPQAPRQPCEREQLLDSGLIFSVREQDRAAGAAEHRARRRRAEEATGQRERVWRHLRDTQGLDAADAWLRDAG